MSVKQINIANDFTPYPAGRYRDDGDFSGEAFREDLLIPALKSGDLEVTLDGVMGLGSSFLEEAFGGLVRKGYSPKHLHSHLTISCQDDSYEMYIQDAWSYIDDAGA